MLLYPGKLQCFLFFSFVISTNLLQSRRMKQKEEAELRNFWLCFNPDKKVDYPSLGISETNPRWLSQKVLLSKNPIIHQVSGSKEIEGQALCSLLVRRNWEKLCENSCGWLFLMYFPLLAMTLKETMWPLDFIQPSQNTFLFFSGENPPRISRRNFWVFFCFFLRVMGIKLGEEEHV